MSERRVAPYGSWESPITSDLIVSGSVGLGQPLLDGDDIYWIEMRPGEGGRSVIVKRGADGQIVDLTPAGFNARTRVHEYGGGDYAVNQGNVYVSNFSDQQIYVQKNGGPPEAIRQAYGASKKAFKQALGTLYKARRIRFSRPGIELLNNADWSPGTQAQTGQEPATTRNPGKVKVPALVAPRRIRR